MRKPIPHPELPPDLDAPHPAPAAPLGLGARLWLVRHAEVRADFEGTAYGDSDVPLSPAGEEQTRAVAARFVGAEVAHVAASPLARAWQMGSGIARASGAPILAEPRFKEVHRGAWQGLPTEEFRACWLADRASFLRDPWRWKGHGGESDADLFARGWPALLEVARRAGSRRAVIASHYNLIRALVTGALGLSAAQSFSFWIRPAHGVLLLDTPQGWVVAARDVSPGPDVEGAAAAAPR